MDNFVPEFVGFPQVPGSYKAVVDLRGVTPDETGRLRLPYIYDPSGNGPITVTVGKPF